MSQPKNIFALLIGINQYEKYPLNGCVNDSELVAGYLEETIRKDQLHLLKLHDREAKKDAIVDAFRKHLGQAGKDDLVFVHYSGHGAQEPANRIFWDIEPDRQNEVLVAADSLKGNRLVNPLADKELRFLINELGAKMPRMVFLFDCCHSGSATRNVQQVKSRFTPAEAVERAPEEFIFYKKTKNDLTFLKGEQPQHILMAACRDSQTAQEMSIRGNKHGVFTYSLIQSLYETKGEISYYDLVRRASSYLANQVGNQHPQLECINNANGRAKFLDGISKMDSRHFVFFSFEKNSWTLDAGAVHGIPTPEGDLTTELVLFDVNSPDDSSAKTITTAKVKQVESGISLLQVENAALLKKGTDYKAKASSIPGYRLKIYVTCEEKTAGQRAAVKKVKQALKTAKSTLFELSSKKDECDYRVVVYAFENASKIRITKPSDEMPLVRQIEGWSDESLALLSSQLEHISRWKRAFLLSNPFSTIPADDVRMILTDENGKELDGTNGVYDLFYRYDGQRQSQPLVKIKIENNSKKDRYYCALAYLDAQFGISVQSKYLFPAGGLWVGPGKTAFAFEGNPVPFNVSKKLVDIGVNEVQDVLKMIVSRTEFNAAGMEMPNLPTPETLRDIKGITRGSTSKGIGDEEEAQEGRKNAADWMTQQATLRIVKPAIDNAESLIAESGVKIKVPKDFRGKFQLSTFNESTEGVRGLSVEEKKAFIPPAFLFPDNGVTEMLSLRQSRGFSGDYNVLEIRDFENTDQITGANPLEIELPIQLKKNEAILPVTTDGEFFYPLGLSHAGGTSTTNIKIEYLPSEGTPTGQRGIGNTLKITFHKVFLSKISDLLGLKIDFPYPVLSSVSMEKGALKYQKNKTDIVTSIKKASNIALVIHGYTGETKDLLLADRKEPGKCLFNVLKEQYDLVLAFDYDSYSTEIETTSKDLRKKLEEYGLDEKSQKNLHIICHSMGGLVSRWYIEQLGGNKVVKHLFMFGTPNGGSPWPSIKQWVFTGIGLILNQLNIVGWPLTVMTFLTDKLEVGKLDKAGPNMKPNSKFLKELNGSKDPGIPYTVVAGNTSIIKDKRTEGFIKKLFGKIGIQNVQYDLLTKLIFKEENDIAVSTASICSLPEGHKNVQKTSVSCDHICYFVDRGGLNKAKEILK